MKIGFGISKIFCPYWHYQVKHTHVYKFGWLCVFVKRVQP